MLPVEGLVDGLPVKGGVDSERGEGQQEALWL